MEKLLKLVDMQVFLELELEKEVKQSERANNSSVLKSSALEKQSLVASL